MIQIKIENHIDEDLEKVNQIVTLLMKQNLILIMINMTNKIKKKTKKKTIKA